jgi:cytochrome c
MDSFEFNKVAGAVLGTMLGVMAITTPGTAVAQAAPGGPASPPSTSDSGTATAQLTGDPIAGAMVFMKCSICHKIGPDAMNSVGPVLNGIINRPAGTYPGYAYSNANKTSGVVWTVQALTQYLPAPQQYIPGTKMPFMLPDPTDVANVIAYLAQFDAQGNALAAH